MDGSYFFPFKLTDFLVTRWFIAFNNQIFNNLDTIEEADMLKVARFMETGETAKY